MHSESQWRYYAYRRGLRLVKFKLESPGYREYGPYALADRATNQVVAIRLDAEAVEHELLADAQHGARAESGARERAV